MKKILLSIIFLLVCFAATSFAEDIGVFSEVNQSQVVLGEALQLTVTVNGGKDVPVPQIPKIDGFDIQYVGPSTRISIVNGQYSSSRAFIYNLLPLKVGQFKIPEITLTADGKNFTTQPIDVMVVDAKTGAQPNDNSLKGASQEVSLKDKIFLVVKPAKAEGYVNEAIPVKILLYVSDLSVRDIHFPEFDKSNFTASDFPQPKQYDQVLNGIHYDVVEFDTTIYPTQAGELKLGPVSLECSLLYRNSQNANSPFAQFDNFFNDDFFSNFNYSKRPLSVQSTDTTINVSPLPAEQKPQNFSGAVGQYQFAMEASPRQVKVGDPVTVKMKVEGDGNLKTVQLPSFQNLDNFKIYDPQIKEDARAKSLDQVFIPKNEKVKEVPAVSFSYFDPAAKAYKTITQGPIPIDVSPLSKDEESKVVGLNGNENIVAPKPTEVLGSDILYLKREIGELSAPGQWFYNSPWYWVLMIVLTGAWVAGFLYLRHKNILNTDQAFAQKLRAPQKAREGLKQAQQLMSTDDPAAFYDALYKIFQDYMSHKFQIPVGEIHLSQITRESSIKISDAITQELRISFEEFDVARFAGSAFDKNKMQQSFGRVQRIIDYFERGTR